MADIRKVATRQSYGEALVELGAAHDDFVVLDADLAVATQTGKFKAAYPDRFIDVGIAEQNLMGVAAGIATTGRKVFASTFAMFAAGRAFEQVRNSIGYPHLHGSEEEGRVIRAEMFEGVLGKIGGWSGLAAATQRFAEAYPKTWAIVENQ